MKRYAHKIRDSSKNPRQRGGGFFMPWLRSWPGLYLYPAPLIWRALGPFLGLLLGLDPPPGPLAR